MDGRRRRVSRSLFRFYSAFALATALAATGCGGGDVGGDPVAADSQCPGDGCAAVRCPVRDLDDACPLGLVPDACACCPYGVCGLGEAAACNAADRPCADSLECVKTVYDNYWIIIIIIIIIMNVTWSYILYYTQDDLPSMCSPKFFIEYEFTQIIIFTCTSTYTLFQIHKFIM